MIIKKRGNIIRHQKTYLVIFSVLYIFCLLGSCFIIPEKSFNKDSLNHNRALSNLPEESHESIIITSDLRYNLKGIPNFQAINAYALVVGVEDYPGTEHDLWYSRDDADDMYNFLRNECNFKTVNIVKLINSQGTEANIKNGFANIRAQIGPNDIFLFFFAGHGNSFFNIHSFLPYDAIPISTKEFTDAELDAELDAMNCAQKYVILDSCYSGGMRPECAASGRYLMFSCSANEYSHEILGDGNGLFTQYVLKSYKYGSDINDDDILSVGEQFLYAKQQTSARASQFDLDQNPKNSDGISGVESLRPSVGNSTYSIEKNNLTFTSYVLGHGLIRQVNITLCSIENEYILKYIDISDKNSTNTGFGRYSSEVSLDEGINITCWEMIVKVEGNTIKYVKQGYGDYDNDGLTDIFELEEPYGTNPKINDTDSDMLSDGDEVNIYHTNPIINDTDDDRLTDGEEVYIYNTLPKVNDTDFDGYLDGDEVLTYGTDPLDPESYPRDLPSGNNDNDDDDSSKEDTSASFDTIILLIIIISCVVSAIGLGSVIVALKYRKKTSSGPVFSYNARYDFRLPIPMRYCPNCGNPRKIDQKFCIKCGKSLKEQE